MSTGPIVPLNPRPMLQNLVGRPIILRLKWGHCSEYTGLLKSVDSYMNLQLEEAVEYENGRETGRLGSVLVRCNNVLWVGEGPNGDGTMEMGLGDGVRGGWESGGGVNGGAE